MVQINICMADAVTIFMPALVSQPITEIRLLSDGLRFDVEQQLLGIEDVPPNFYEAVKSNSNTIAKTVGVDLIWVSLEDFSDTIPVKPEVVSGPAIRLQLLDQVLLDAFNYAFWSWWNGEDLTIPEP